MTLDDAERRQVDSLVERDLIREAETHLAATKSRKTQVSADLDAATVAFSAAKRASEEAIGGVGDPLEAEHTLEAATRRLNVAQKVDVAAASAIEDALAGFHRAVGRAWQPVYLAGVERRIEAGKKADQARALLAEAAREHSTGTAIMQRAHLNGCEHPVSSLRWNIGLHTEEDERLIWGLGKVRRDGGWTIHVAFGREREKA